MLRRSPATAAKQSSGRRARSCNDPHHRNDHLPPARRVNPEPAFDAGNNRAPFFYSRYGSIRLRDYILRVKRDF